MVDGEVVAQARRDDQGRDPSTRSPDIMRAGCAALAGRCDMVPLPAELIVGGDDQRVLLAGAALDRFDQIHQMLTPARLVCVSRMFVIGSERLDKAHRPEIALPGGSRGGELHEFAFMSQVLSACRRARGVARKVVQGLVMELEQLVRAVGVGGWHRDRIVVWIGARGPSAVRIPLTAGISGGVIPTSRVPRPVNAGAT